MRKCKSVSACVCVCVSIKGGGVSERVCVCLVCVSESTWVCLVCAAPGSIKGGGPRNALGHRPEPEVLSVCLV